MFTQIRLHLVNIAAPAIDPFVALFADAQASARMRMLEQDMTHALLWDLLQYLDLADAGYGDTGDTLYLLAQERLRQFVAAQPDHALVRELQGKSCALARMVQAHDYETALALNLELEDAQAA